MRQNPTRRQVLFGVVGGWCAALGLRPKAAAAPPRRAAVAPAGADALASVTTYTYDGGTLQVPVGSVTTYTYDPQGRLLSVRGPAPAGRFGYDHRAR